MPTYYTVDGYVADLRQLPVEQQEALEDLFEPDEDWLQIEDFTEVMARHLGADARVTVALTGDGAFQLLLRWNGQSFDQHGLYPEPGAAVRAWHRETVGKRELKLSIPSPAAGEDPFIHGRRKQRLAAIRAAHATAGERQVAARLLAALEAAPNEDDELRRELYGALTSASDEASGEVLLAGLRGETDDVARVISDKIWRRSDLVRQLPEELRRCGEERPPDERLVSRLVALVAQLEPPPADLPRPLAARVEQQRAELRQADAEEREKEIERNRETMRIWGQKEQPPDEDSLRQLCEGSASDRQVALSQLALDRRPEIVPLLLGALEHKNNQRKRAGERKLRREIFRALACHETEEVAARILRGLREEHDKVADGIIGAFWRQEELLARLPRLLEQAASAAPRDETYLERLMAVFRENRDDVRLPDGFDAALRQQLEA